eukprot:1161039-Pelagomonas_calceolata.AAC.3
MPIIFNGMLKFNANMLPPISAERIQEVHLLLEDKNNPEGSSHAHKRSHVFALERTCCCCLPYGGLESRQSCWLHTVPAVVQSRPATLGQLFDRAKSKLGKSYLHSTDVELAMGLLAHQSTPRHTSNIALQGAQAARVKHNLRIICLGPRASKNPPDPH